MSARRASFGVGVAAIAVATSVSCNFHEGPRSVVGPSTAAVSTLAVTSGGGTSIFVSDILHVSEEFSLEVAALQVVIEAQPPSGSPGVRSLLGAVQLEAGYEFLIGQFSRLNSGDQQQGLQLLQGALAQLKAFKKKLEVGLANETLPDDVRRAAVPPLDTAGQLQSLILLALGCSEAPC